MPSIPAATTSLRFEAIVSDWRLPLVRTPAIDMPLRAVSTSVEGRYKIRPGLYVAARSDHLTFSTGHRRAPPRRLGRAGHPPRGRRRLLAAAQRHAEAGVPAQYAADNPRRRRRRGGDPAGVLVLDRDEDAEGAEDAERRGAERRGAETQRLVIHGEEAAGAEQDAAAERGGHRDGCARGRHAVADRIGALGRCGLCASALCGLCSLCVLVAVADRRWLDPRAR